MRTILFENTQEGQVKQIVPANELINILTDRKFLNKLYGYAYKKCRSSHEAEDLCSDIVLEVLKSIDNIESVKSFYAYVWKGARNTYADHCRKSIRINDNIVFDSFNDDLMMNVQYSPIDEFIETEEHAYRLNRVMHEILFLSKIYRDVMIMYYIDDLKIPDIALKLGIKETTVKQRLFSARNIIKKEAEKVDKVNLAVKPIELAYSGNGNPVNSYPFSVASRAMSKNVLYLCKDTERSAKEISDMIGVPAVFIEEELRILENGSNGKDGLVKRLENGKYISTFAIIDYTDILNIEKLMSKFITVYADRVEDYVNRSREKIMSFPFLNKQDDFSFVLWTICYRMAWRASAQLQEHIIGKYYSNVKMSVKDYYPFAIAINPEDEYKNKFIGCDGITTKNVCGYKCVTMLNIYSYSEAFTKSAYFHCGTNIAETPYLEITVKAVGGLDMKTLNDEEKEAAAHALEVGLIKIDGDIAYPVIPVIDSKDANEFYNLANGIGNEISDIVDSIADDFYILMKKYLPKHLMCEAKSFIEHTLSGFDFDTIVEYMNRGILNKPEKELSPEGVCMFIEK